MLLTKSLAVPNSAFRRFLGVREEMRVSVTISVRTGSPGDHPVQRRVPVLSNFAALGHGRIEQVGPNESIKRGQIKLTNAVGSVVSETMIYF